MRAGTAAAAAMALGGVLYHWFLRDRLLNWGAQQAEVEARLPGDELLEAGTRVCEPLGQRQLGLDVRATGA